MDSSALVKQSSHMDPPAGCVTLKSNSGADEEQRSRRRKRDAGEPLRHEGGWPRLSGQPALLQSGGLNGRSVILQRFAAPGGLLPPPRRHTKLQLEALRPTNGSRCFCCYAR